MCGVYKYKILKDAKLVLHYHQGDVNLAGLMALKQRVVEDPDFDRTYDCITDLQRAKVHLSFEEVFELLAFYKKLYEGWPLTRHALVNDQPMSTAMSLLFAKENRNPSKDYHVCSSMDAAIEWLGREGVTDRVISIFREMYEPLSLR